MLALGALVLLRDRDSFARLAADEVFVAPYIEELLRYLTVVQVAFPRFARTDAEIGGSQVRRGDIALCALAAAGRDPAIGAHPSRSPRQHHVDRTSRSATGSIAASEPSWLAGGIALLLAFGLEPLFPVTINLSVGDCVRLVGLSLVVGVAASMLSVRGVVRVDPALAFANT